MKKPCEKYGIDDDWILQNLSFWLQKEADDDFMALASKKLDFFRECLDLRRPSAIRILAMRCIQSVLGRCDSKTRFMATDLIKMLRRIRPRATTQKKDFFFDEMRDIIQKTKAPGFDWNGRKAVFCISHDIDYRQGYDFSAEVVRLDRDFGVSPTVNMLTNGDYAITEGWFKEVAGLGAEIGLHGSNHNIVFGYLRPESIRNEILRAKKNISFSPLGFRSPALSISFELLEILSENGFVYDSSFRAFDRERMTLRSCFPFRFPSIGIWEFPVCLQDTDLFRDMKMAERKALRLAGYLIEKIIEVGGMGVFNFHPCIIRNKIGFYKEFLRILAGYVGSRIWIARMAEVADLLNAGLKKREVPI